MEKTHYELRGPVAVVRMDDGKVNAISFDMLAALSAALVKAEAEAKAVVLTGRPGQFSAGFDLKVMMSSAEAAVRLVTEGAELFMRLYEHPLPIVAAVSGNAIAGGALLAATADVRVGTRGAFKIGLNEVANGMTMPILAHELARDRLDPRHLLAATLFARLYDPEAAREVGWLDETQDADALEARALAAATELAKLPAQAYARSKASLRRETIRHIRETLAADLKEITGG